MKQKLLYIHKIFETRKDRYGNEKRNNQLTIFLIHLQTKKKVLGVKDDIYQYV